jgi:regulatory protein
MRDTTDNKSKKDKPKPSAYAKALGLLARREHSRRELGMKLGRGGFDRAETADAVSRLGDEGYQDDARFGEMLVRSRISQAYGPMRIRAELKSKGIAEQAIRQLLDEAGADWPAIAAHLLERRYGRPSADPAERVRRAQFLLRRGFTAATVRPLTHADVDDAADD